MKRKVETKSSRITPYRSSSGPQSAGDSSQGFCNRTSCCSTYISKQSRCGGCTRQVEGSLTSRHTSCTGSQPRWRSPNVLHWALPALELVAAPHLVVMPALEAHRSLHGARHKKVVAHHGLGEDGPR